MMCQSEQEISSKTEKAYDDPRDMYSAIQIALQGFSGRLYKLKAQY